MNTKTLVKRCLIVLITVISINFIISRPQDKDLSEKHRVAVLIPFVGQGPESIPPYFPLFCISAAGSARLVDFFIIHNGSFEHYYYDLPSNVFLINLESTEAMVQHYLLRVVDDVRPDQFALESRELLVRILTTYLEKHPYVLVEFKPALGHIFSDFLKGYSHWAYSDLDIVFGDMPHWMDDGDELINYDIVTYGFGDSDRAYLRGQWTVHRNDATIINQLWRSCEYLSRLDDRFAKVLAGEEKIQFESAEACYSVQVLLENHKKVRAKLAVKAFTDVHRDDSAYTHGVYLATGVKDNFNVLYKKDKEEGRNQDITNLDPLWFEKSNYQMQPLQVDYGPISEVSWRKDPTANCMYWVREIYRSKLCIEGVTSLHTMVMAGSQELTKQAHKLQNIPLGIVSAPLFHFQEWKRSYRHSQIAAIGDLRHQSGGTWILIEEGVIPLPPKLTHRNVPPVSPLGIKSLNTWHASERSNLPPHPYCLISGKRHAPPLVAECRRVVSWRMTAEVQLVSSAPGWKNVRETKDVTLALTLQLNSSSTTLESTIHVALSNVNVWRGQPCVLVIFLQGDDTDETKEATKIIHNILYHEIHDKCLVALIIGSTQDIVSRRALLNMAMDAAPTRWTIAGIELERGLVLSKEASFFCQRRAEIHGNASGQAFILPQFAITKHGKYSNDVSSLSITELIRHRVESSLVTQEEADNVETGNCEDDVQRNEMLESANSVWWGLTKDELDGLDMSGDYEHLAQSARISEELEEFLMKQMVPNEDDYGNLFLNDFPILMVDNAGPNGSILTHLLVREVEELVGNNCYNGLRLVQLATLGYNIYVLPSVFAASNHASRSAVRGQNVGGGAARRCEKRCANEEIMEDIFETIVEDEINRVSKTAVVLAEASAAALVD